ncbi:MAG TPA: c-type cytochrome [Polyangiaceae bacterium]
MKRLLAALLLGCAVPVTAPASNDAGAPVQTTMVRAIRLEGLGVHEGSTVALARAGGKDLALVSDEEAVRVIDLGAKKELSAFLVRAPAQILVLADGRAALAADDAVVVLEMHDDFSMAEEVRWPTTQDPKALASALDDSVVYVASDARVVQGFRPDGTEIMRGKTSAMPRAVAADDKNVLVVHAAMGELTVLDAKTGADKTTPFDATLLTVAPIGQEEQRTDESGHVIGWAFANGMGTNWARLARSNVDTHARHAYALARTKLGFLIPHEQMLPRITPSESGETMQDAGGYGGAADLGSVFFAVADANGFVRSTTGECTLPRGAAWDEKTETFFVACSGNDWVVPLRLYEGLHGEPGQMWRPLGGPSWAAMSRIKTCAGPDGIAIDRARDRIVVSCSRDAAITVATLSKALSPDPERIAFSRTKPADAVTRGRDLFFRGDDGRISKDGRACATCHLEGTTDGLVWNTPRGLRNPPSLAGRGAIGPFGWNGQNATLADHVANTIRVNLSGRGLPKSDLDDLAAYVASIPAARGNADARAERGKELFASRDCVLCHASSNGDHAKHDVRSGGKFETPSLAGLARSAPYFHDGRFATLEQLLDKTRGSMGSNEKLSENDRDALAAYLRTL